MEMVCQFRHSTDPTLTRSLPRTIHKKKKKTRFEALHYQVKKNYSVVSCKKISYQTIFTEVYFRSSK